MITGLKAGRRRRRRWKTLHGRQQDQPNNAYWGPNCCQRRGHPRSSQQPGIVNALNSSTAQLLPPGPGNNLEIKNMISTFSTHTQKVTCSSAKEAKSRHYLIIIWLCLCTLLQVWYHSHCTSLPLALLHPHPVNAISSEIRMTVSLMSFKKASIIKMRASSSSTAF